MLPVIALRLSLGSLLAADVTYLAQAAANKIALVMANFVPGEQLIFADLTLATFDGSVPIAGVGGAQLTGEDPATGDQIVTIKEPAGSWRWVTTGVTNLPQTIYGYALINNAGNVLYATQLLPAPLTLNAVGQEINLGTAKMTMVLEPLA
jgi:hypothetical protein